METPQVYGQNIACEGDGAGYFDYKKQTEELDHKPSLGIAILKIIIPMTQDLSVLKMQGIIFTKGNE